ncbi:MAG: hypothetical protein AAGH15_19545, partial [Myxococcota bacterium]
VRAELRAQLGAPGPLAWRLGELWVARQSPADAVAATAALESLDRAAFRRAAGRVLAPAGGLLVLEGELMPLARFAVDRDALGLRLVRDP